VLDLPAPASLVPIRISGGASDLGPAPPRRHRRRLAVSGGISDLCLDDQAFGAIGGGARLATGPSTGTPPTTPSS
jgi:hypothetical protein